METPPSMETSRRMGFLQKGFPLDILTMEKEKNGTKLPFGTCIIQSDDLNEEKHRVTDEAVRSFH